MSKLGYISRYSLIVNKIRQKPYSTYEELRSHIEYRMQFMNDGMQIGYSKRTLQRDFKEIYELFGFDIQYDKKEKGYFISDEEMGNASFLRMMEAFDVFHSLGIAQDIAAFVHTENRRPRGTENLYGLLHAIRNRHVVTFSYEKFWESPAVTQRKAEPYLLKEFRNRWYLIAKDSKDERVKSFALDRLSDLDITKKKYKAADLQFIEQRYRYCFGIVSPNSKEPHDIVLSFDPFQGKYIKSLPLHDSQQILIDNEEELRIRLKLFITYDLVMELLSLGDKMKVLKPASLATQLRQIYKDALGQYEG